MVSDNSQISKKKDLDNSNRESESEYGRDSDGAESEVEISIEEVSELDSELNGSQSAKNGAAKKERSRQGKRDARRSDGSESEEPDADEADFACVPASNLNKDTMTFVKLSEVSNVKDGKGENYDSSRGGEAVRSMVMCAGSQLLQRGTQETLPVGSMVLPKKLSSDSGEDDSQISINDFVQKDKGKEGSQLSANSAHSGKIVEAAESGLTISGVSGVNL